MVIFTQGEDDLGGTMKKIAIVLTAAAVLFVAAAPSADAANKKLWEGWMADVKTLQSQIAGSMGKK